MPLSAQPSPEEAAAIVAAIEALRPRATVPAEGEPSRWRWSGRWWGPVGGPSDRRRPWVPK